LELASGVALRGLAMTQEPSVTYVESDLPELTDAKVSLVSALCRQYNLAIHGNLHLVAANALDNHQLQTAVKHFRRHQPVGVVHEGLLPYLSACEMVTVA